MTPEKSKRAQEIVEHLEGTCKSLEDEVTEEEMMDEELLKEVDYHIFCCNTCGWWHDLSDEAEREDGDDDRICESCAEE